MYLFIWNTIRGVCFSFVKVGDLEEKPTVQMRCCSQSNEKLTPIGPGPTVGHTERTFGGMFKIGVKLVFEFAAVDGRASTTGAGRL